jgi:hypothetical protein
VAAALPADVARPFWDTEPEQVDLRLHGDCVMERAMSRGTWAAMRWLRDMYSSDEMADFLVRKGHRRRPASSRTGRSSLASRSPHPRGGARAPWPGLEQCLQFTAGLLADASAREGRRSLYCDRVEFAAPSIQLSLREKDEWEASGTCWTLNPRARNESPR